MYLKLMDISLKKHIVSIVLTSKSIYLHSKHVTYFMNSNKYAYNTHFGNFITDSY